MQVSVAGVVEDAPQPDVEGVPARQLKAIYEEHLDCDPKMFAERISVNYQYLQRKLDDSVIPLGLADQILFGLGLDVAELIHREELTIVPLRRSVKAAQRILDSEVELALELDLPAPTSEQRKARIEALLADYDTHCVLSERTLARRAADRKRKQAKKGSAAAEPSQPSSDRD